MQKTLFLVATALIFVGCGPSKSEYNALVVENAELKKSYDRLEIDYQELLEESAELEWRLKDNETNPAKLESEIKEHLAQKDFDSAYKKAVILEKDYPTSSEAIRSKPLYNTLKANNQRDLAVALSNLKSHKSGGVVWHYHKDLIAIYESTAIFAYIVEKSGDYALRVRFQQFAPSGATLEKIELDFAHEIYKVEGKITSKAYDDGVNLYIDNPIATAQNLLDLIRSDTISFFGSDPALDLITPKEKEMIQETIRSYRLLTRE